MKVRMRRAEIAGKFVESITPDEGRRWNFENAVFGIELFDGGTPVGRVTLPEDFLQVSVKKFDDSLRRTHVALPFVGRRRIRCLAQSKRTAVRFYALAAGRAWTSVYLL